MLPTTVQNVSWAAKEISISMKTYRLASPAAWGGLDHGDICKEEFQNWLLPFQAMDISEAVLQRGVGDFTGYHRDMSHSWL